MLPGDDELYSIMVSEEELVLLEEGESLEEVGITDARLEPVVRTERIAGV